MLIHSMKWDLFLGFSVSDIFFRARREIVATQ
jgi:hypothetical protein